MGFGMSLQIGMQLWDGYCHDVNFSDPDLECSFGGQKTRLNPPNAIDVYAPSSYANGKLWHRGG